MADVSKLVRARLAKMPVTGPHPGWHPDADQLTAFAERSLAGAERDGVLAHLATCTDCREVVALAAPEPIEELETAASAAAVSAPARPRWLPWPVGANTIRWGAVAAAVAVVAVAVVMQSPRMQQSPLSARVSTPSPALSADKTLVATAEKPAQAQPPALEAGSAGKASMRERDAAVADLRAAEVKNNTEARLDELTKNKEGLAKQQKKEDGARTMAAVAPPAPVVAPKSADAGSLAVSSNGNPAVSSNKVREEHAAGGASAGMVAQAERNEPFKDAKFARRSAEQHAAAKPSAPPATAAAAYDSVAMAKAAPSPEPAATRAKTREGATPAAMSPGLYGPGYAGNIATRNATLGEEAAQRAELKPATLRWTVTSDGRVQRSRDGGRNWADVPIAKDKALKFRALAADGDEIWAGGASGALYYSANAGSTWRPHPLPGVTGDIIRLSVSGKSLIVSTSSGQTITVSHDAFADTAAKPPSSR
ncbi:MAG: zf-HC2 domain-containing protein [Acidobacteriota bacterium]|nr:zf-HC2 domain-containing protein [Acidobacteriota bacterium]